MSSRFLSVFFLAATLITSASAAENVATREYPLPNFGQLQLSVPNSWKDHLRQPPQGLPPTITFSSSTGNNFNVQVTPIWAVRPSVIVPGKDEIRKSVARAADEAKTQSVEKNLSLKEITGTAGSGYYFSATDGAPKPGEFKYLTQGTLRLGEIALMFTVLTNSASDSALSDALEIIKTAKHVAPK